MAEADAMNVTGLSQDLTFSDSPFCMETNSADFDMPQNEIKNVERESEVQVSLSEGIYSTLDNLISDINIEKYSQNVLIIDNRMSSLKQFEPTCKFHWTEIFNDEMTSFQNSVEDLTYAKEPESQSHICYERDGNIKKDWFKEENPAGISSSTKNDLLASKLVSEPSRSPPLTYCYEEKLNVIEKPPIQGTAEEAALSPTQPQSFLYKECVVYSDAEEPFTKKISFHLLNQRANYEIEAAVSSNEIQNSGGCSEMSVSPKEVGVGAMESLGIFSTWSPADLGSSGGGSKENCKACSAEGNFDNSHPLEEDMALNEVLQKLKHTNKRQQTQIQDLHYSNRYLEKKVEELQTKITKQQVLVDIINKLKENIEQLIEDKYKVILEKNDTDRTLKNMQEVLSNTQKHLQESRNEKKTLQLELKKIKVNCVNLHERYLTEVQQKNISMNQCIDMDKILSKKTEEVERLQQLKEELEKATASALDLLKREKETREQEFLALQEKFQKREEQDWQEKQKMKSSLEKLVMQVKHLQFLSENERAKNVKLQQQISELKSENAKLQQIMSEEQHQVPNAETAELTKLEEVMRSDNSKDAKVIPSSLFLNCLPCEEESSSLLPEKRTQMSSNIHNVLSLIAGFLTCQDTTIPDAEYFKESEKLSDIMLQKLKSFHLKKKHLDKELLKHKARITTIKELIANEKAFQDQAIEAADFDSNEVKNFSDVTILLGTKLDKYHSLNEELDFLITKLGNLLESKEDHCNRLIEENDKYQRHLGNLINKVTSYEEIIECADKRLEISHSQIVHLEERNKHLEDLIGRPKERIRKLRPRRLENHPKSMTVVGHPDDHFKGCFISM